MYIKNTLNKDLLRVANNKPKKRDHAILAHSYHPGTDLYSIMKDKITVVMVTLLFKVSKEVGMT